MMQGAASDQRIERIGRIAELYTSVGWEPQRGMAPTMQGLGRLCMEVLAPGRRGRALPAGTQLVVRSFLAMIRTELRKSSYKAEWHVQLESAARLAGM